MRAPTLNELKKLAKLIWAEVEIGRDECNCDKRKLGHLYFRGANDKGYTELISIWCEDEELEREAIGAVLLRLSELREARLTRPRGTDKPGWLTRQMDWLDAQAVAWPRHRRREVEEKVR